MFYISRVFGKDISGKELRKKRVFFSTLLGEQLSKLGIELELEFIYFWSNYLLIKDRTNILYKSAKMLACNNGM